jgi:uncharacterized protein (TIGR02145 family)
MNYLYRQCRALLSAAVGAFLLAGCGDGGTGTSDDGTFTDERDGAAYKTAKIGGKTWMAQNLNFEAGESWCYDENSARCATLGRLYTYDAAKTSCPAGWHLPSRAEWDNVGQTAGGSRAPDDDGNVDWNGAGKKLKSKSGWGSGNGTDAYGFAALPGGYRAYDGDFDHLDIYGSWWTSETAGDGKAYRRRLNNNNDDLYELTNDTDNGFSVRCVKD